MSNLQIKFNKNWNNKLGNNIFTTIRKSNLEKDTFYWEGVGKTFDIILKGDMFGKAKLKTVDKRKLKECDRYLLRLDVGETSSIIAEKVFEELGIEYNDEVLILTFETEDTK